MTRRVHLHIGLPKTGTTFLQTTMWHNRALLRERGLLYPGRARLDHYNAFQQVRSGASADGPGGGAWDRLAAQIGRWDGDALISHEFFSMATRKQVARVATDLEPAELHVVVTARSYVRQLPAVWQEALKMKVDSGFDAFMEDLFADRLTGAWGWASQDVPAVLKRWSSVVPADRITLITVPPPGGPRDLLWRRWCEAIGLDDSGFDLDVNYPNESLGAPQAALLRRVKPHLSGDLLEGPVRHRWVRRYFGHEVLVPQGGARFAPRKEHRDRLLARVAEAITAIDAGGYRVIGDLDELLDPGPLEQGTHPDDVPVDEVLDVAARAIEQMIHDVQRLTAERDQWRRRADARTARGFRALRRRIQGAWSRRSR